MGYRELSFKLPTDYSAEELSSKIEKKLSRNFESSKETDVNFRAAKCTKMRVLENQNPSCTGIENIKYQISKKSLDARKKNDIHWLVKVLVKSKGIKGPEYTPAPSLNIPYRKRNKKIVVVGSGPAGFFSAFVLQKAGFDTTIIERGADVIKRAIGVKAFEKT